MVASGTTLVSSSAQVVGILSSLNTYTGSNDTTNTAQNSRLTSIESATGSYETRGRSIVSGSSQVSYTGLSSIPSGIVSGSSQITISSTTGYGSVINQAVLTSSSPTFAGGTFNGGIQINQSASEIQQIINSNGTTKPSITQYRVNNSSGWEVGMANAANSYSYIFSYGEFGPANSKFTLTSAGTATFAGTITENSSLRYKENVETIHNGLDKVLQMRGVTYNKKDGGIKEVGVIAEEIYDVLPEVVLKNEEGEIDSVSYGRIVGVLIEAIKDLKKEIEDLKANR